MRDKRHTRSPVDARAKAVIQDQVEEELGLALEELKLDLSDSVPSDRSTPQSVSQELPHRLGAELELATLNIDRPLEETTDPAGAAADELRQAPRDGRANTQAPEADAREEEAILRDEARGPTPKEQ